MENVVRILSDVFGMFVRLSEERLGHILEHPEMRGMETEISLVLQDPERVVRSRSDPEVRLFYDFLENTPVGNKWLCVVVKYSGGDAFVVTAYLTDKVKIGEELWPEW